MVMRCVLAAAALTSAAGVAAAADLPLRSPPPAPYYPAPVYSWTGFYAGANIGGAFDNQSGALVPQGFAGLVGNTTSDSTNGFMVGGQIGYNWQNGAYVYGFETDIDYTNLGGGGSTTSAATPFGSSTLSVQREDGNGFLGTARGRLGYAGFDRTLLYVTGGLAYGDFGSRYKSASFLSAGGLTTATYGINNDDSDDVRVGYAIGAGLEYAITPNISVKGEYLFVDLGRSNYSLTPTSVTGAGTSFRSYTDGSAQTVKIGLNYKFNAY
jgi:outer membrane immunogenic protein